ncbi:unnamed protein product, partial [Amoebophrya sp. A120]|eukprot:GSA120T00014009001.1
MQIPTNDWKCRITNVPAMVNLHDSSGMGTFLHTMKTPRPSKHQTRKFLSRRRAEDDVDDEQTEDLDAATTEQVRTLAQSEQSGDLQAWAQGSLLEDGSGAGPEAQATQVVLPGFIFD